jgi:2-keto-4-pentenoate hydratase
VSTAVTQATLDELAQELFEAGANHAPVAPLSKRHPELTVADAYAIQGLNAMYRPTAGHKIGLTSKAMQDMLGVGEPDYGRIYSDELLTSGATVERDRLIAPRVEPEIAFVLSADLPSSGVTTDDVLAATDYVLPALEVIDSRIADWKIKLVDTVADNASCARVVLGEQRTRVGDVDLAAVRVALHVDDETVQMGQGSAVLGHPAEAVAWLANAVGQFGATLVAGDVIMPGSLTAAVPLEAGSDVVADFGALGTAAVSCR